MNIEVKGCCIGCDGTGMSGDFAVPGGKCWDCRGTGHAHAGSCDILTTADRQALLDQAVVAHVQRGGFVTYRTHETAIVIHRGKTINNVLHAALSIFTFGAWLVVWALVAIYCATNPDRRITIWVDEGGTIHSSGDQDQRTPMQTSTKWIIAGGIFLLFVILVLT